MHKEMVGWEELCVALSGLADPQYHHELERQVQILREQLALIGYERTIVTIPGVGCALSSISR